MNGFSIKIGEEELLQKINGGKRLIVKLGIDPTSPNLHLGFLLPLMKMRQFLDDGHKGIIVIGDATAKIGDPTGRDKTRTVLSHEEIQKNIRSLVSQMVKFVPTAEYLPNSWDWDTTKTSDFLQLTQIFTTQQILQRDDFSKRIENNQPLGIHELLYPIMQGADSWKMKADVELGGQDQLFNCQVGRKIQEHFGDSPQAIFLTPILKGTDGKMKMSKSFNNTINLTDPPLDMFSKVMSISDELMKEWFPLFTDGGTIIEGKGDPFEQKKFLADIICSKVHGKDSYNTVRDWEMIHSQGMMPTDIPPLLTKTAKIVPICAQFGLSNSEVKRLIKQGAVKLNGQKITSEDCSVFEDSIVQVGKKKIGKVKWDR